MSPRAHFVTAFVVLTNLLVMLMHTSKYSPLNKSKSWSSGLSISTLQASQSVNEPSHKNAMCSADMSLVETGYTNSSSGTQLSSWGGLLDLTQIMMHFNVLKNILDTRKIPWSNVYNMDEKGCQQGGG
ncbi:hypothetical protein BDN67DRAFT_981818 [Paxillus ammoniavirescens]|nr:hypothetical protein BDN67DRAFT_981818 [Paxillus ammoniavirescens]